MRNHGIAASLLLIFLSFGCTKENPHDKRFCGETFCVASNASSKFRKDSPVEDFNVYILIEQGKTYEIYEGSNPGSSGTRLRHIPAREGVSTVDLFRDGASLEVRFDRGAPQIPFKVGERPVHRFIVLRTACPVGGECGIAQLAARLTMTVP